MEATCHAPTLEQVRGCGWLAVRQCLRRQAWHQQSRHMLSLPAGCGRLLPALSKWSDPSQSLPPTSPSVPQVYSEVYRVLKPGAIFMTYE